MNKYFLSYIIDFLREKQQQEEEEKSIKKISHSISQSGPKHLTADTINWENNVHRMSVTACLVKGAYVLEQDKQRKPKDDHAPQWCEAFDFKLFEKLFNDSGSTIYGAIYEYKPRRPSLGVRSSPRYVIALRGTLPEIEDVELDFNVVLNRVDKTPRYKNALTVVEKMVDEYGESNVWLAGHSLGAAIAMLVGKKMAKKGKFLQSFIFNPPFQPIVSVPVTLGNIDNKKVKRVIRVTRNTIVSAVVVIGKNKNNSSPFDATLSKWEPCLFVNPKDPFGSECISYFELRGDMEKYGLRRLDRFATQYSLGGSIKSLVGKDSESFHLIPSANLTVNEGSMEAHGINQWWQPNLDMRSTRYSWPTSYC